MCAINMKMWWQAICCIMYIAPPEQISSSNWKMGFCVSDVKYQIHDDKKKTKTNKWKEVISVFENKQLVSHCFNCSLFKKLFFYKYIFSFCTKNRDYISTYNYNRRNLKPKWKIFFSPFSILSFTAIGFLCCTFFFFFLSALSETTPVEGAL